LNHVGLSLEAGLDAPDGPFLAAHQTSAANRLVGGPVLELALDPFSLPRREAENLIFQGGDDDVPAGKDGRHMVAKLGYGTTVAIGHFRSAGDHGAPARFIRRAQVPIAAQAREGAPTRIKTNGELAWFRPIENGARLAWMVAIGESVLHYLIRVFALEVRDFFV